MFETGDTVRIKSAKRGMEDWIGLTATVIDPITEDDHDGDDRYRFIKSHTTRPWGEGPFWWTADSLELVEEKPAVRPVPSWRVRVFQPDGPPIVVEGVVEVVFGDGGSLILNKISGFPVRFEEREWTSQEVVR